MIKDVPSSLTSKIAIREIGIKGDSLRVVFDLFSTQDIKMNNDPIERTIDMDKISEMKQAEAWASYKKDKSSVKVTYDDADHLVRNTDPFFMAAKEFVDIATKTASAYLNP